MERQFRLQGFPTDNATLMLQETLFHNANGYLGVRGTLEENVPPQYDTMRGTYINGFYDVIPMKQAESLCNLIEVKDTMLNVADMQSIRIRFGGEEFSLFSGTVAHIERVLDMNAGITRRTVRWRSPKGSVLTIRFTRMASFTHRHIFTYECDVCAENAAGTVEIVSEHIGLVHNYSNPNDPRVGANDHQLLSAASHGIVNGASCLTARTAVSGLTVATAVRHSFDGENVYDPARHAYVCRYARQIAAGEHFRFVKYTAMADSLRSGDPQTDALMYLDEVYGSIERLYAQQREYLDKFWLGAQMTIDSDDDSATAMAFNQYQLLQSCGGDGLCSVSSKGLSGEGYEGHYFWDTEIYLMPFFTYTNPKLARGLLGYRYRTLDKARENAKIGGHTKGALYPWRTISGRECSGYFVSGKAAYHINGDIACALVRYYLATGDRQYLADEGAEILIETARLWIDAGNYYEGRFIINDVTGPDEYTCLVNNNYYTNACAKFNMEWAVRMRGLLTEAQWADIVARTRITDAELDAFAAAAKAMYLPYDEKLGINPQDDSFLQKQPWDFANTPKENYPLLLHYHPLYLYRHQVCKQADTILAYFLFGGTETRETMRRSFEYYEKVTTHDSSLSNCIFSIVASRLGERDKAWSYFGESIRGDMVNSHGNTRDGIHTANMGGSYMMIVNGFAGMEIDEDCISFAPFVPKAWRGYRFRVRYRGSLIELSADHSGSTLRLLSGESVHARLCGRDVELEKCGDPISAEA